MKSISEENHMYIHVHTCAKVIVHSSQDCLSNCIWQYTWPRGPLNGSLHSLGCRSWWRNLNAKSNHVCPKNGALTCIAFTCIAFTNPLVAPSKTRLLTNLHTFGSFFLFSDPSVHRLSLHHLPLQGQQGNRPQKGELPTSSFRRLVFPANKGWTT